MKNDNVASFPNDTVSIICKIVKDDHNEYSIIPLEVAFGKIDNETNEFTCCDNNSIYPPLDVDLEDYSEDVRFYVFPKSINDLKLQYGEQLSTNSLMISYLRDVLNTRNFGILSQDKLDIHSVPKTEIESRSGDPIYEVSNTSTTSIVTTPAIITAPNLDTKALPTPGRLVDPTKELIDLEDFIKFMNERLVRNEDTMESLCTTVAMNFIASTQDRVHNILSIGPTGSGKSQTFKTMKEYLAVPIVICDCNELSAAGYVGKSVDDFLLDIYLAARGNVELANRAIFVLDEIDKLKKSGLEMKEAAQNALLKVIEGQIYTFETDKKYGTKATLDTGWMTVVGCGAFSEIFEERKNGSSKKPIGFGISSAIEETKATPVDMMMTVTDEELKKYGFKSEFIPRFQRRYTYRALDEEGLRYALLESKNSALLNAIRTYAEKFNCDVVYDDSFIDAVVAEAVALEQGGRSLTKIVAKAFDKVDTAMYIQNFKDQQQGVVKKRTLKITGDTVSNPRKFDII